ncbi:MAG: threonine synthase [Perlabentimonas sp.]
MSRTNFFLKCIDCGREYNPEGLQYLCPTCEVENTEGQPQKGVLKAEYRFTQPPSFDILKETGFIDLLPIQSRKSLPNLRVGNTPTYCISSINNAQLPFGLYIKDDSQNPTFSFKDRASAVVSAYAKENAITTIVAASTGNAGSSLAGICAAQGQRSIIMVPESAPIAKLTQIIMYGATVVPVKGTYDDAFDLSMLATREFGWYNRNTAYNPYTIEGKKTAAFEIFDQLGKTIPDRIFVPVGDGVIISGIYKGFEDLLSLGIIQRMPIIVAVQSEGSQNLLSNLNSSTFKITPSRTIADSISVDVPRNFNMASQFIDKYYGETIVVSDSEIIEASSILARNTGIFAEPAAAAAFAGMLKYHKDNKIPDESKNVVLLTGSGLKDLKGVERIVKVPHAIEPNIRELKRIAQKI